jgi:C4-dicarboxylate-specific signal transduction histidine kinase
MNVKTEPGEIQAQLERLETEFAGLQKQLWHAQRLSSLGTMAAMVAHEYNNLMTPIVSFAKYALDQDDDELMRSALQKCLTQAQRAAGLSAHILSLAADQDKGPTAVPLRELITESIECLGRDLDKDNIGLSLKVDPELRVRANPAQMQQVLVNLIQNARQAMLGRRGRLTIEAQQKDEDVELRISDTGCGIRSEDLPHIFEPFFTTKSHEDRPDKRGIGLGLAVCQDIVTGQDGRINVESRLGHGTTFILALPAAR